MTTATDHARPRSAEASRQSVEDVERGARIRELENELERYRHASDDALQQLDWCIGYMCGWGRVAVARSLSKNRSYIRTHLLRRAARPLPLDRQVALKKLKRDNLTAASLARNSSRESVSGHAVVRDRPSLLVDSCTRERIWAGSIVGV